MQRINLADYSRPKTTFAEDEAARMQNRDMRAKMEDANKVRRQQMLLEQTVRKHAIEGPDGVDVDHDGVLRDLYKMDATLAKAYEDDVLKDASEQAKLKRENDDATRKRADEDAKLTGEALMTVNEDGDQNEAAQAYATAVQFLRGRGVKVADEDAVYNRARVKLYKKTLIPALKRFEANEKRYEIDTKEAGDTRRTAMTTGASRDVANINQSGANYRHVTPPADALLRAQDGRGGRNGASKQGQIDLRTDPEFKRLRGTNFAQMGANFDRALQVMSNPDFRSGPGAGATSLMDRAGSATDAFFDRLGFNPAKRLGRQFAPDGARQRITADAIIDKVATLDAINALGYVGGNDTDKDFDRALKTTINKLQNKQYNMETLKTARELLRLGEEKQRFMMRWTSAAGSLYETIDGIDFDTAWSEYSRPKQVQIANAAMKAGVIGRDQQQAYETGARTPGTTRSGRPADKPGFETVIGPDGKWWYQNLKTGSVSRAN